jgi:hypothetical protein
VNWIRSQIDRWRSLGLFARTVFTSLAMLAGFGLFVTVATLAALKGTRAAFPPGPEETLAAPLSSGEAPVDDVLMPGAEKGSARSAATRSKKSTAGRAAPIRTRTAPGSGDTTE